MANTDTATKSATLRAELKEWERAFAAANGGRKAGREDIKKDFGIAAKYKEYNRLKSLESSSSKHESQRTDNVKLKLDDERSKKRKHASPTGPGNLHSTSTPRKTAKGIFATPSKNVRVSSIQMHHPAQLDPYDSPSSLRRLFSPSTHRQDPSPLPLKTAIGPTPQRDGKALGLFDLLSESGGSTATPSARKLAEHHSAVVQTPSKKRGAMDPIQEEEEEDEDEDEAKGGRSPASYCLENLFATPTTLRYAALVEDEDTATFKNTTITTNNNNNGNTTNKNEPEKPTLESSTETPFFLRRYNSSTSNPAPGGVGFSPTAIRKPPPFVGKGLSALVQGLRDMEYERMNEDWDVLREVEAEQRQQQEQQGGSGNGDNVQVTDSQNVPSRPWKKKGQKRTTRRVVMKPVVSKRKQEPRLNDPDEEDEDEDELAAVADTQPHDPISDKEGQRPQLRQNRANDTTSHHTTSEPEPEQDSDSNSEFEVQDSDADYTEKPNIIPKRSKPKSFSEKIQEAISTAVQTKPSTNNNSAGVQQGATKSRVIGKEDEVKQQPRARKVNPEAHANYRTLKIRNKGSKGRGFGRFRRR